MKKSFKINKKRKTSKSRKNKRNNRNVRGGVGSFKIRAEPAVEIASKTASFFLNQLFKPLQDNDTYAYDTIEKTKYNFGSYDNMIQKLSVFIGEDNMFENTIIDAILKSMPNKSKPEYIPVPLPSILKIVTSLKLVPSNLAYYFTKNPERLLKTSIIEFIPDYLQKYIDVETSPPEKLEDILKTILAPLLQPHHVRRPRSVNATMRTADATATAARKVATRKTIRRSLRSSERMKDDIIEQIKYFIMKTDYNKTTQNSWYLTTILLELVTNLLGNLQIYSGPLLGLIREANNNQLITCELLNFLIIQSPDKTIGANIDINFNLVKLYNYINKNEPRVVADVDDIDVEDFTIMDFFDESKNSHGALPPFILFILFCRINPEINNEKTSNSSVMDYKRTLIEMTEVNKINCTESNINIDDSAAIEQLRRANRTINPNRTVYEKATGKNKYVKDTDEVELNKNRFPNAKDSQEMLREQVEERDRESYHSDKSSSQVNSPKALSPDDVTYHDAETGYKIKTTCTPVEISTSWFGKAKDKALASLITSITGTVLNPIFSEICKDLYANKFSWKTLNVLTNNLSLISKADAFKPVHNIIITKLCYNLAPYTTFSPLDLNRYISDEILRETRSDKATTKSARFKSFLLRPRTPFLNIISFYETKIIEAFKTDKEYTDPLCVPTKIMDAIKPLAGESTA